MVFKRILGIRPVLAAALGLMILSAPMAFADSIPAQFYSAHLAERDVKTGSVSGIVSFPSEYSQRSTTFELSGKTFVTTPDGRFTVERIPPGKYLFSVNVRGYDPYQTTISIVAGRNKGLKGITLRMARSKVAGRLVHPDGTSAQGITVMLSPNGGTAITDKDGVFQFMGVPTGNHTLQISDSRYMATSRMIVTVKPAKHLNLGVISVIRRASREEPTTAVLEN